MICLFREYNIPKSSRQWISKHGINNLAWCCISALRDTLASFFNPPFHTHLTATSGHKRPQLQMTQSNKWRIRCLRTKMARIRLSVHRLIHVFSFSPIFSEIMKKAEGMLFFMFGPMSNQEITYMLHCLQKEQSALAVNVSV